MVNLLSEPPPSLRESKKRQTRATISDAATALFAAQGFEKTTIADVARAAGVSKMTVTNYFPLKEDLVFDRAPMIIETPGRALANRPPEMSALSALRAAYLQLLGEQHPTTGVVGPRFSELVQASPALLARERVMFDEREAALAGALAAELGPGASPVAPRLAAAHLDAIVRVLYYEARRRLLAGERSEAIVAALAPLAHDAFDRVASVLPPALLADPAGRT